MNTKPLIPNLLQLGVIHTCVICAIVFQPKNNFQKSCGNEQCQIDLRNLARRKRMKQGEFSTPKIKTCELCNKKYEALSRDNNSRTCSQCSTQDLISIERRKEKVTKHCAWCNKPFLTSYSTQNKFCPNQRKYLRARDRCSYKYFEAHRYREMREPKTCEMCGNIFFSRTWNAKICKDLECILAKDRTYTKKYSRKLKSWLELKGYLYCLYNKEYNIYKIGISSVPKKRIYEYSLYGFELKALYKFKNKREASFAEKEFYIQAESMGISPNKKEIDTTHFFKRYMRSGYTEIVWGEMIRFNELRKMLNSLMGKVIN